MKTFIRFTIIIGLMCTLLISNQTLAEGLSATVDRTSISANETISLTVRFDSFQVKGSPDFSRLTQNFDILSNRRSTQKSIINGKVTASTEWRLALFPKKIGQLLLPPLSLQGFSSKPITINVTQEQQNNIGGKPDVFLETLVNKSDIYVQEQFIVTYKLFFNRNVRSMDSKEIDIANVRVEELPRSDYQKQIGQKAYGVAEFRFALIPDASGDIVIPAQTWTVQTTDQASMNRFGFNGGRQKLHRVKTKELTIHVKPKPSNYPTDQAWLPASNVSIAQAWSRPPEQFKVGEPITRTVTIQAQGVGAEQLPPIFTEESTTDFKFYPDKPSQDNHTTAEGISGTRTESIAIVPSHGGNLTLPEVSVTWWDTNSQSIKKATLPAVQIHIVEAINTAAEPATVGLPTAPLFSQDTIAVEKTPILWAVLLGLSLLANIALITLLWKAQQTKQATLPKKTTSNNQKLSHALAKVASACKQGNPTQLRTALLEWSTAKWPMQSILRLEDIASQVNHQQLAQELNGLNSALFSEAPQSVDYKQIHKILTEITKKEVLPTKKGELKPLYGA